MFAKYIALTVGIALLFGRAYADCSDVVYVNLAIIAQPDGCIPSGYFQAQAFNQITTSASLTNLCELQCSLQGSKCQAYVGGIWKAADTGLISGQCFFYPSSPTGSVQCASHPTEIYGRFKYSAQGCFASSAAVASAYCGSILSVPTLTVKVTSTPLSTTTRTQTTVVSQTHIVCEQVKRKRADTVPAVLDRRALPSPTPACLVANLLAPLLASSACGCLQLPTIIVTKTVLASQTSQVTETVMVTSTAIVEQGYPGNLASFDVQVVDSTGSAYYMNVQTDQESTFGFIDPTDPMLTNVDNPPKFIENQNTIILDGNFAERDVQGRFAFSMQQTSSSLQCTALENLNDEILCTLGGTPIYFQLALAAAGKSQRAVLATSIVPAASTQVHLFAANAYSCQK